MRDVTVTVDREVVKKSSESHGTGFSVEVFCHGFTRIITDQDRWFVFSPCLCGSVVNLVEVVRDRFRLGDEERLDAFGSY